MMIANRKRSKRSSALPPRKNASPRPRLRGLQPFSEPSPERLLLLQRISSKKPASVVPLVAALEGDRPTLSNNPHAPVPPVLSSRDQAFTNPSSNPNPLTVTTLAALQRDCGNC